MHVEDQASEVLGHGSLGVSACILQDMGSCSTNIHAAAAAWQDWKAQKVPCENAYVGIHMYWRMEL